MPEGPAWPSVASTAGDPAARPAPAGLPGLDADADRLSRFEFWPAWRFYKPVPLYLLWLGLRYGGLRNPLAANPGIGFSGMVGESKIEILTALAADGDPELMLAFAPLTVPNDDRLAAAKAAMEAAGLRLPLVAKPDISCRGAGVQLIADTAALDAYLAGFPAGAAMVLQELAPAEGEVGLYYVRPPGASRGFIFSLTLKYFPTVIGDGETPLEQLILAAPRAGALKHLYLPRHAERLDWVPDAGERVRLAFAGSHSKGAIFRDGQDYITEALTHRIDAVARRLPGFHIGRFDLRFDDFAALRRGEGFKIIEINGAGAEATHIWDSRTRLRSAYATLYRQWRWLYRIGQANRRAGVRPAGYRAFLRGWAHERRLTRHYPSTH